MKSALVVGGGGFLGARLVDALVGHARVAIIDPALREGLGDVVQVLGFVDKRALATVREAIGEPDVVFHLGGSGSVGAAESDPAEDRRRTIDSTQTLLAGTSGRVVLVSSAAVYGEGVAGAIAETHACRPISTYGKHKLEAEALVQESGRAHAVVRFFSIYGPGLRKQLLWDACHKLRRGDSTFAGTGDELRDWLHVDDAVALLERAATHDHDLVINGGTGVATSVRHALEVLGSVLDIDTPLTFSGVARAGDPRSLVADVKSSRALDWSARHHASEGIAEYARWFEAQSC